MVGISADLPAVCAQVSSLHLDISTRFCSFVGKQVEVHTLSRSLFRFKFHVLAALNKGSTAFCCVFAVAESDRACLKSYDVTAAPTDKDKANSDTEK